MQETIEIKVDITETSNCKNADHLNGKFYSVRWSQIQEEMQNSSEATFFSNIFIRVVITFYKF